MVRRAPVRADRRGSGRYRSGRKPDASSRFLWAEYGLEGERMLAAIGMQEIMVAGAGFEPATFGL